MKQELQKFQVPVDMRYIQGNIWEETFRAIAEIKETEKNNEILINVSTGNPTTRCAATSAAFVNGLKAFVVEGNETSMLPVLKFSYYRILSDKKIGILQFLDKKGKEVTFDELCQHTKMSLPLVSYHLNGNLKSEGLKELGLVETVDDGSRSLIRLTMLGRLLIKGYVQ